MSSKKLVPERTKKQILDGLEAARANKNERGQLAAVKKLADRGFVPELEMIVGSLDVPGYSLNARLEAVHQIGEFAHKESLGVLNNAIKGYPDENPRIKRVAVLARFKIQMANSDTPDKVFARYMNSERISGADKMRLLNLAPRCCSAKAIGRVVTKYVEDGVSFPDNIRRRAVVLLGDMGTPQALEALFRISEHPLSKNVEPQIRRSTAQIIKGADSEKWINPLAKFVIKTSRREDSRQVFKHQEIRSAICKISKLGEAADLDTTRKILTLIRRKYAESIHQNHPIMLELDRQMEALPDMVFRTKVADGQERKKVKQRSTG